MSGPPRVLGRWARGRVARPVPGRGRRPAGPWPSRARATMSADGRRRRVARHPGRHGARDRRRRRGTAPRAAARGCRPRRQSRARRRVRRPCVGARGEAGLAAGSTAASSTSRPSLAGRACRRRRPAPGGLLLHGRRPLLGAQRTTRPGAGVQPTAPPPRHRAYFRVQNAVLGLIGKTYRSFVHSPAGMLEVLRVTGCAGHEPAAWRGGTGPVAGGHHARGAGPGRHQPGLVALASVPRVTSAERTHFLPNPHAGSTARVASGAVPCRGTETSERGPR